MERVECGPRAVKSPWGWHRLGEVERTCVMDKRTDARISASMDRVAARLRDNEQSGMSLSVTEAGTLVNLANIGIMAMVKEGRLGEVENAAERMREFLAIADESLRNEQYGGLQVLALCGIALMQQDKFSEFLVAQQKRD